MKTKPESKKSKKAPSTPKAKSVRRHRNGPVNKALRALCRRISRSPYPALTKALLSTRSYHITDHVNGTKTVVRGPFHPSPNLDPGFSPKAGVFTS
jgi:hypothetical protein